MLNASSDPVSAPVAPTSLERESDTQPIGVHVKPDVKSDQITNEGLSNSELSSNHSESAAPKPTDLPHPETPAHETNLHTTMDSAKILPSRASSESAHSDHLRLTPQPVTSAYTKPTINCDVLIVGTSITTHIDPQLMYKYKSVHVHTLIDKTLKGALAFFNVHSIAAK